MKFSLRMLTHRWDLGAEFVSAEGIMFMAWTAEENGFDSVNLTHHWIPEADWLANKGIHPVDPWVALGIAAAATTRLRLMTNVIILPYQNPFITAKSAATVDAASGGRLILGVGAGFLKPEFDALGVDFDERNELMDESLGVMRIAWRGETFDFEGKHFSARNCTMLPTPVQQPGPPVWIGGNSKRAMRRAIELADGWIPIQITMARTRTTPVANLDEMRARVEMAREMAEEMGRKVPLTLCTSSGDLDFAYGPSFDHGPYLERLAVLREMGFTHVTTHLPAESRAEYAQNAARFKEHVIDRVGQM